MSIYSFEVFLVSTLFGLSCVAQTQSPVKKNTSGTTVGDIFSRANDQSRGAGLRSSGIRQKSELPTYQAIQKERAEIKKINLDSIKPPSNSAFVEKDKTENAKLETLIDQQIKQLYNLVSRYRNSPQRGELWLRLASLYVEKAGIVDARIQSAYDKALADFYAGKTKVKPKLNMNEAREYNRKAIQLYEYFARDFPKDPKMEEALFFLGFNNIELGDEAQGVGFYQRLIEEYPKSNFVLEANFALAEVNFEKEKWEDAFKYYYQVLQNRKHRLYTFSLYKASWCLFRAGQADKAIKYMESLIRTGRKETLAAQAGRRNINKNRLETEGLRDLIMMYAETGDPAKAPEYFRSLAGKDYLGYVEKLAYYYVDKGNREAAKYLFEYLIRLSPNAPKNFEYQYQVVLTVSMVNKPDEFKKEMYQWIRDYGKSSSWYQANRLNKELIETAFNLRETTIRNYVLQNHQTAQNTKIKRAQTTALEGYQLYVQEFSDSPVIADMRFYYGELLFDMNQFGEASDQYRWVVENASTSKFYQISLINMVLSAEKKLPTDQQIAQRVGTKLEPVDFDPDVARFVSVAGLYLDRSAKMTLNKEAANRRLEIMFRRGRLYYQHNQFEPAKQAFQEVVKAGAGTQYAEYSANLLLDIYNLQKDYVGLEKTAGELLAIPTIANSKIAGDLRDSKEKAAFKNIQSLEQKGDLEASAKKYEEFALGNPKSPLYTSSLFNAAINYEKAGKNDLALRSHLAVISSQGTDAVKFRPLSRKVVAQLYSSSGRLEEAAQSFQYAAKENPKDPLQPNLLFNAAVLFEALGRNDQAVENYQQYAVVKPGKDAADAWISIGRIYQKQGKLPQANAAYDKALGLYPNHPSLSDLYFEKYKMAGQMRDRRLAGELRSLAVSYHAKSPKQWAGFVAKIKLEEAEQKFAEMKKISIDDPKTQKVNVEKKIAAIERITKDLAEIIKLDSREEIVAASCILGQINHHMAVAFQSSPVPDNLKNDPEKVAQYKAAVRENFVDPFMTKATAGYKVAVDKGRDLDVDTPYFKAALEYMNTVDPKNYYYGGEDASAIKKISINGQVM